LEELHATIDKFRLDQYVYRRTTNAGPTGRYYEWPTMEMRIVNNIRLVIFAHGDGMDSSCASVVCPEGFF
jgi:hypothetical protein